MGVEGRALSDLPLMTTVCLPVPTEIHASTIEEGIYTYVVQYLYVLLTHKILLVMCSYSTEIASKLA